MSPKLARLQLQRILYTTGLVGTTHCPQKPMPCSADAHPPCWLLLPVEVTLKAALPARQARTARLCTSTRKRSTIVIQSKAGTLCVRTPLHGCTGDTAQQHLSCPRRLKKPVPVELFPSISSTIWRVTSCIVLAQMQSCRQPPICLIHWCSWAPQ
jgi:hypothetical protein